MHKMQGSIAAVVFAVLVVVVPAARGAALVPLYKYKTKAGGFTDHIYTTDITERGQTDLKGIECYIYPTKEPKTVPLYRYFRTEGSRGDTFYSTTWLEEADVQSQGITGYVHKTQEPGTTPLYEYSFRGGGHINHYYTTDFSKFRGRFMTGIVAYVYTCARERQAEVFMTVGGVMKPLAATSPAEPMSGWAGAMLQDLPAVFKTSKSRAHIPNQRGGIDVGATFTLMCPESCDQTPCEFYVTQYRCPGCSSATNGGLPAQLLFDGWSSGACAPLFTLSSDLSVKYQMGTFARTVPAGKSYTTPETTGPLHHFAIFSRYGASECYMERHRDSCEREPDCVWRYGACESNWCPRRHSEPSLPTETCAEACPPGA